jgi:hypothetical protein
MNIEALRKALPALPAKDQSFAQSLLDQHDIRGSLSEKQAYWVNKLAAKAADPARSFAEPVKVQDVYGLVQLFRKASETLKHPAIVFDAGDLPIRLSVAGERAKVPGSINVTSPGSFENRVWYGRVLTDGTLVQSRDCTPAVVDAVKALAADPAKAAAAYGRKTGCCCFCARELTDARSVEVGYGPICADHYGLPWGA